MAIVVANPRSQTFAGLSKRCTVRNLHSTTLIVTVQKMLVCRSVDESTSNMCDSIAIERDVVVSTQELTFVHIYRH